MPTDSAKGQLLEDRRRLLEHVIHVGIIIMPSLGHVIWHAFPCTVPKQVHISTCIIASMCSSRSQVHKSHGGRLQLPIGMTVAEPWLLDSVDVTSLLSALSSAAAAGSKPPTLELLSYCQKGARYGLKTRFSQ